ncbi:MAG TPA: D-alanine--D-alanine ligase [Spirochaetia bacterium]|nr:D-alanine--D-alanine ligase [Spirochaetia bacterium]
MDTAHRKLRVAIIFGGRSAEHEVSLQSAKNVLASLDSSKYEPVLIGIDREGRWYLNRDSLGLLNDNDPQLIQLNKNGTEVALAASGDARRLISLHDHAALPDIDVIFPVLHGPYGEDGTIQGLAKLANLPCVGSGVLGSAVSMDKDVMKRLLREADIPTPDFLVFRASEGYENAFEQVEKRLGMPVFVKPANLGSSVGVSKVKTRAELEQAFALAFQYDTKLLVEEAIIGREIEVSVLGNDEPIASLPGEVIAEDGFYSYDAKYIDENGATLVIPARMTDAEIQRAQEIAIRAYRTLCASGMSRADLFLKPDGSVLVNEINTIPGFTRISMYPKLWEVSGIGYVDLVDRLITLAIEEFDRSNRLKTTPR